MAAVNQFHRIVPYRRSSSADFTKLLKMTKMPGHSIASKLKTKQYSSNRQRWRRHTFPSIPFTCHTLADELVKRNSCWMRSEWNTEHNRIEFRRHDERAYLCCSQFECHYHALHTHTRMHTHSTWNGNGKHVLFEQSWQNALRFGFDEMKEREGERNELLKIDKTSKHDEETSSINSSSDDNRTRCEHWTLCGLWLNTSIAWKRIGLSSFIFIWRFRLIFFVHFSSAKSRRSKYTVEP